MESGRAAVNNWDEAAAERAVKTWGTINAKWTHYAFEQAIREPSRSFIDIGCGFGRFYSYLCKHKQEFFYYGFDSSDAMLQKAVAKKRPDMSDKFSHHDILKPILPNGAAPRVAICNAVLIHLPDIQQGIVLSNIRDLSPDRIIFDINCSPNPHLQVSRFRMGLFYMNWSDADKFHEVINRMFSHYQVIERKFFPIRGNKTKCVYRIERDEA